MKWNHEQLDWVVGGRADYLLWTRHGKGCRPVCPKENSWFYHSNYPPESTPNSWHHPAAQARNPQVILVPSTLSLNLGPFFQFATAGPVDSAYEYTSRPLIFLHLYYSHSHISYHDLWPPPLQWPPRRFSLSHFYTLIYSTKVQSDL